MATVTEHYERSRALEKVAGALERLAPDGGQIGFDQLGGFDHFHTGGALATERMAKALSPSRGETVLDAGAGLGGPARFLANKYGCRVIGVDLTPLFVEVGHLLNDDSNRTARSRVSGTWVRIPAPSPELGSAPAAPR